MFARLRLARQRRRAAASTSHGALAQLLAQPLPAKKTPWREVRYVALDLETTGLDPAHDQIIAVGWTPVVDGRIRPGDGGYCLVQTGSDVGQSATVHGLTDSQLRTGHTVHDTFERLVTALDQSVMVVHHAPLDTGMLHRLSRALAGVGFYVPVIDTLAMARARLSQQDRLPADGALRLDTLRNEFGLPRYASHHGLTDAIATAELFCALVQHRFGARATFGDVWP